MFKVRSFVPYNYNIVCLLSFCFHYKNNVFALNFHHLLTVFLFRLQMCDSSNVCFAKCVLWQLLVLSSATSFIYCQINFGNFCFFFLYIMIIVPMKEV
jgi:hypothetical protein